MPNMKEWEAWWNSLSVEQRQVEIQKRPILPALAENSRNFEERRKRGFDRKVDLVPSFIGAYKDLQVASRHGSKEEKGLARFHMNIVRTSAKQQLSAQDFARFERGIK